MGKIAIVTDSTSGLTEADTVEYPNLVVVPETVTFDGKTYREGIDIDKQDFYTWLHQSKTLPTTAPPTTEYMKQRYDELADQGFTAIISIHLTLGITTFLSNLKMALQDYDRVPVTLIDSYITAMPMSYLVRVAAKMAQSGAEVDDIVKELDYLRSDVGSYFIVSDLKNLVKGGRLKNAAAVVGTMLQVRPILSMMNDQHEIRAIEKVRTAKRAQSFLENKLAEEVSQHHPRVFLLGTDNADEINAWYNELAPQYPDIIFEMSTIGPVVGTHIGSGTMAVAWTPESHIEIPVLNRL